VLCSEPGSGVVFCSIQNMMHIGAERDHVCCSEHVCDEALNPSHRRDLPLTTHLCLDCRSRLYLKQGMRRWWAWI
jgi:hypothetical protein